MKYEIQVYMENDKTQMKGSLKYYGDFESLVAAQCSLNDFLDNYTKIESFDIVSNAGAITPITRPMMDRDFYTFVVRKKV